eukprot:gene7122-14488_t
MRPPYEFRREICRKLFLSFILAISLSANGHDHHTKELSQLIEQNRMLSSARGDIQHHIPSHNSSLPTFIHIPKAGGTSIEQSLMRAGIAVSRSACLNATYFKSKKLNLTVESFRLFKTLTNESLKVCSTWHIPPAGYVPRSITVVRHPIKRLLSQFCFVTPHHKDLRVLNCQIFNSYINTTLNRIYTLNKTGTEDCHWVPQWEYAKYSHQILSFSNINTSSFWNTLSHHFGVQLRPIHSSGTSCDQHRFQSPINESCITSENRIRLNDHFKDDFKNLNKYF